MTARVLFQWAVSTFFGWGVYGLNLALHMRGGEARAICSGALAPERIVVDEIRRRLLADFFAANSRLVADLEPFAGRQVEADCLVLHGLGNRFELCATSAHGSVVNGRPTVGVIFLEDTALDAKALERAKRYVLVVAGSSWNERVLRAAGLESVATVLQGVDTTLFHPAPSAGFLGDRFAVFSGGKVEFRKGQDLVLRAFRAFRSRHPEAVLVTAWHSPWPAVARTIPAVAVAPVPVGENGVDVIGWAAASGIPAEAVIDLGAVPNALMPPVLREMDVALFPNRGEGGTNLVAMEAMACGVPCILSANTGHLDLIEPGNCLALARQAPVPGNSGGAVGTDGWGESDVDEMVEALEAVWRDRQAARAIGRRGAETLARLSWPAQIDALRTAIRPWLR